MGGGGSDAFGEGRNVVSDILTIPHGAIDVGDMLAKMTEAEREEFFEKLDGLYCRHCGRKQPDNAAHNCQCWNDE